MCSPFETQQSSLLLKGMIWGMIWVRWKKCSLTKKRHFVLRCTAEQVCVRTDGVLIFKVSWLNVWGKWWSPSDRRGKWSSSSGPASLKILYIKAECYYCWQAVWANGLPNVPEMLCFFIISWRNIVSHPRSSCNHILACTSLVLTWSTRFWHLWMMH